MRSWEFLSYIGVVVQPWRRVEKLVLSSGSCVAPLRLGGIRGKQSTPSVWLGGTGVVSTVSKQEWHGVGVPQSARTSSRRALRKRYAHVFSRVDCLVIYFSDYDVLV